MTANKRIYSLKSFFRISAAAIAFVVLITATVSAQIPECIDVFPANITEEASSPNILDLPAFPANSNKKEWKTDITLTGGTYYFDELKIVNNVKVTLDGPVLIFVNNEVEIANNVSINVPGNPADFVLISYEEIKISNNTVINGILYAEDDIELEKNVEITGAVTVKDEVETKPNTNVVYDPTAVNQADFGGLCSQELVVPQLIAEYRMDSCDWDGTSGEVIDSSGNAHHGITVGQVRTQYAKICQGALFDGNGSYIEVADASSYLEGLSAITVMTWIKNTDDIGHDRGIFTTGTPTNNDNRLSLRYDTSGADSGHTKLLKASINTNACADNEDCLQVETESNLQTKNQWQHVTMTWASNNKIKIYINGSAVNTTVTGSGLGVHAGTLDGIDFLRIGQGTKIGKPTPEWMGAIDEFMIFDKALNSTQITSIYKNQQQKRNWDGSSRNCTPCKFCFEDNFERTNLGPNWSIIKNDYFTPEINSGKLLLTDTVKNAATGVSLNGSFPAQDNYIEIEFEHNAYGSGGSFGGDGIVLVLSDADVPASAGGYGGSLGYANRNTIDGFAGGWLGFGIDEFGNFSNPNEGRIGGPGNIKNSVAVRGHGSGETGYVYLSGTTGLTPKIDAPSSSSPAPGHRYRFIIDTYDNKTLIKVERDSGNGFESIIPWTDVTQNATAPKNFQISITGATGNVTNIHSFDDFVVRADKCGTIGGNIDHFEFIHDGQGLTCAAETVTLKACANTDCSARYTGTVEIILPDLGWLEGTEQNLNFAPDGEVSLKLKHTTAEDIIFNDTFATSANEATHFINTSGGTANEMTFSTCEFDAVEIGKNIGGPIYTKLVGEPFDLQLHAPMGFSGTLTVDLINNPDKTITAPQDIVYLPDDVTTVTFDCDKASRNTSVRIQPTLEVEDAEEGVPLPEKYSSDSFAIRPLYFSIISTDATNTEKNGKPTIEAGTNFNLTAKSVKGYDETPLIDNDKLIGSLNAGTISGTFNAANNMTGTATGSSFTYSEVGHFGFEEYGIYDDTFTLVDQAKDQCTDNFSNSLSENGMYGCKFGSKEIPIELGFGRFIPAYFELTQGDLTNRVDSNCSPESLSSFTYLGENLKFAYTLTAKNTAGVTTKNYYGEFAKFSGETLSADYTIGAVDVDPDSASTNLSSRVKVTEVERLTDWNEGEASFSVTLNVERLTEPDGFFTNTAFGVFVKDEDGVEIGTPDLDVDGDTTMDYTQAAPSTKLRYGRIRLENAHGSELLPLNMPFYAEYFNGHAFILNSLDSCTEFALAHFGFSNDTAANGKPILAQQIKNGVGALSWNAPPYALGNIDVKLDLSATGSDMPWLQFDWDGDDVYDDNPTSRATFGIFKGNERIIYLRETTWRR